MVFVQLRPSAESDQSFVDRLTRLVMEPYVRKTWQNAADIESYFLKNKFNQAITSIVQFENQDIGRVSVTRTAKEIIIDNIHILPEYQGKGIGSQIIRGILKEADKKNIAVTLLVLTVNPAKKLYDNLGFVTEFEKHCRYHMRRQAKIQPIKKPAE